MTIHAKDVASILQMLVDKSVPVGNIAYNLSQNATFPRDVTDHNLGKVRELDSVRGAARVILESLAKVGYEEVEPEPQAQPEPTPTQVDFIQRDKMFQQFQYAIAWGAVYGKVISPTQWDMMRDKMANQYVEAAIGPTHKPAGYTKEGHKPAWWLCTGTVLPPKEYGQYSHDLTDAWLMACEVPGAIPLYEHPVSYDVKELCDCLERTVLFLQRGFHTDIARETMLSEVKRTLEKIK